MFSDYQPITSKDAAEALEALKDIKRPDGDNEGDSINSPSVYNYLSPGDQELVDSAGKILYAYVRKPGDEGDKPNKRAITELKKRGYSASLNTDQYDQDRLVGHVEVGDWSLNLSDPAIRSEDE